MLANYRKKCLNKYCDLFIQIKILNVINKLLIADSLITFLLLFKIF